MKNDILKFISDILANDKLTPIDKQKIIELAKKDISGFSLSEESLSEKVEKVENKIDSIEERIGIKNHNIVPTANISVTKDNLPIYLNPKDLKNFLLDYNQDSILKYTCHEIDDTDRLQNILTICNTEKYIFDAHLKKIHTAYKALTYKYQGKILNNIVSLISTYLGTYNVNGKWSENNIDIKWTSSELKIWANENVSKVPNPSDNFQTEKFRFNTIDLNNGNSISTFSELVIYFKNLFHFKNGNTFKSILEGAKFMHFNNDKFNITFDDNFSETIELFTYSETLIQAFIKIINLKFHRDEYPILNAKLYFNYDTHNIKEFKIVILNSKEFGRDFRSFRYGDDFTDLINKQINGLSDLYIKAYFRDMETNGIVNIWNGKPIDFKPINEEIEGVEFILKMY